MKSEKLLLRCEECPYAAEEIWYRKAIFGYDPHKRYDLEESDYQTEYCICAKTGGKMAYWGILWGSYSKNCPPGNFLWVLENRLHLPGADAEKETEQSYKNV